MKFTDTGGFDVNLDFLVSTECFDPYCGILVTTVRDTGCGMSECMRCNLFQIFGNIKRVSSEDGVLRSHGIGLGLSICRDLV